jgi:hypothetical protein
LPPSDTLVVWSRRSPGPPPSRPIPIWRTPLGSQAGTRPPPAPPSPGSAPAERRAGRKEDKRKKRTASREYSMVSGKQGVQREGGREVGREERRRMLVCASSNHLGGRSNEVTVRSGRLTLRRKDAREAPHPGCSRCNALTVNDPCVINRRSQHNLDIFLSLFLLY